MAEELVRTESRYRRINRLKRKGRRHYSSLLYSVALLFVALTGRTLHVHRDIFIRSGDARAALDAQRDARRLTTTPAPTPCTPSPTAKSDDESFLTEEGFFWKDPLVSEPYADAPASEGWRIIFHIMGVCWMFVALMIICDNFFCPALEEMVSKWQIKEDVAGATFMAAGGSAPELFTSLIGTLFAKSDVGFGTIVGSAVFNVLFVIGLCAVASGADMPLTWWPLFRDCTYYIIGLGVLAAFVFDQNIQWWEALVLFLLYIGYVTVMYFNEKLEAYVRGQLSSSGKVVPKVEVGAGPTDSQAKYSKEAADKLTAQTATADADAGAGAVAMDPPHDAEEGKEEKDGEKKEEEEEDDDPWAWPDNKPEQLLFIAAFPLKIAMYKTLPDCSKDEQKHLFLGTFFGSLVWIAIFSYFMVWWATIVGYVCSIPPVVMGLTFLAAGTSIPDALSSVYMAKMGEGDMAISSSIGSNVFDILVGLPIPWMVRCFGWSTSIDVVSPFVVVHVLLLLFMVVAVVFSIAYLGWKLDMRLGMIFAGLYFVFLVCALYLELWKPSWASISDIGDDPCGDDSFLSRR